MLMIIHCTSLSKYNFTLCKNRNLCDWFSYSSADSLIADLGDVEDIWEAIGTTADLGDVDSQRIYERLGTTAGLGDVEQCYSKCGTRTGDGTRTIICRYADIFQKREKQQYKGPACFAYRSLAHCKKNCRSATSDSLRGTDVEDI